jgi:hypothetical protein
VLESPRNGTPTSPGGRCFFAPGDLGQLGGELLLGPVTSGLRLATSNRSARMPPGCEIEEGRSRVLDGGVEGQAGSIQLQDAARMHTNLCRFGMSCCPWRCATRATTSTSFDVGGRNRGRPLVRCSEREQLVHIAGELDLELGVARQDLLPGGRRLPALAEGAQLRPGVAGQHRRPIDGEHHRGEVRTASRDGHRHCRLEGECGCRLLEPDR